ncbi:MAG: elongation factor Ts [Waddliaceae bacterium]|jgi:elongation factor Ts|nr:elongation factor Ts [Waddliaceae bacterium]MBT3579513.1 elongation factor Ts [Waddliaceae bacterium]MBT4445002.1 elongation factor Ts [Waddliaceae bacterium]MBT6928263.1 elongation factor Ts [Waddliaceae bacterium]MBT7264554.1 elongation factor Ts [Waddliaceae bacterium]
MVEITAQMVKELRHRSGVGMSKCKEALKDSDGSMEAAIAYLRKAGMATAIKKEGREAKEGLIGIAENDDAVVLVEINAETDFVTKNDNFKDFLSNIAAEIASTRPADLEVFATQKYSQDSSMTIEEYRASIVQSIGENIKIKRFTILEKKPEASVGVYSHMRGKIVAIVEIEGAAEEQGLAKDLAMQVAAEAPDYLAVVDIPEDVKSHEEDIARGQVKNKPENIIEKIVEGKLKAFYNRVCLMNQQFIKDGDFTVAKYVEKHGKEIEKPLTVTRFIRWSIG